MSVKNIEKYIREETKQQIETMTNNREKKRRKEID